MCRPFLNRDLLPNFSTSKCYSMSRLGLKTPVAGMPCRPIIPKQKESKTQWIVGPETSSICEETGDLSCDSADAGKICTWKAALEPELYEASSCTSKSHNFCMFFGSFELSSPLLTCTRHLSLGELWAWIHPHDARQRLGSMPIWRDDHQSYTNRNLYTHCKDSHYEANDHAPLINPMFSSRLIWASEHCAKE